MLRTSSIEEFSEVFKQCTPAPACSFTAALQLSPGEMEATFHIRYLGPIGWCRIVTSTDLLVIADSDPELVSFVFGEDGAVTSWGHPTTGFNFVNFNTPSDFSVTQMAGGRSSWALLVPRRVLDAAVEERAFLCPKLRPKYQQVLDRNSLELPPVVAMEVQAFEQRVLDNRADEYDALGLLLECIATGVLSSQVFTKTTDITSAAQMIRHALLFSDYQPINLEDAAEDFHVPARTLNRGCGRLYGMGVMETLRCVRLQHARSSLRDPKKFRKLFKSGVTTVERVAYAHGFKHPSRFTYWYKQRYGVIPSEDLATATRCLASI